LISAEEWRPIDGYPKYEVSSLSRVRNPSTGRIMRPKIDGNGYLRVGLSSTGAKVKYMKLHRLTAIAFLPNHAGLPYVRHLNDVKTDNRLVNLAWGTPLDNQIDAVRNGVHGNTKKTHCPAGHAYTPENTKMMNGRRSCRECWKKYRRDARAKQKAQGIAAGDRRHGTIHGYTGYGCRCILCSSAWNAYRRDSRALKAAGY